MILGVNLMIFGMLCGIWYWLRLIFREIRKIRNKNPDFDQD